MQCCSEDLLSNLLRNHGNMDNADETEVIKAIQRLAVKTENVIVARVRLLNMKQDRDELVLSFVAKLRGQANVCKYVKKHECPTCKTPSEVNYSDDTVRDALARGLVDSEIQADILGNPNQDMPLEEMIALIEAKESGKESAALLSGGHTTNALRSSYKRDNTTRDTNSHSNNQANNPNPCGWCGRKGHGNNWRRPHRKENCPAFKHKCAHCNKSGHYDDMCRTKRYSNKPTASAVGTDHFNTLITPQDIENTNSLWCNASSHE